MAASREGLPGFTAKYGVTRLVWFEPFDSREGAFRRERQMKTWNRAWKLRLIEADNPAWSDLYDDLFLPIQPLHPDLEGFIDPVTRLPYSTTAHPRENPAHHREGGDPRCLPTAKTDGG